MKYCKKCGTEKPLAEFAGDKGFTDGHKATCKACEKPIKQAWYQKNRAISIERAKQYRIDHPEWAKTMNSSAHRSEFSRSWRDRNPEKAQILARRTSINRRFKKHGLTQEQYISLLASQNNVCAACHETPVTSAVRNSAIAFDNFVIDHCHASGVVRGIVCNTCNVALGMIRDNPNTARKLAAYLEAFNSRLNCGSEVQIDVCASSSELNV